jgi:hypothetical protein
VGKSILKLKVHPPPGAIKTSPGIWNLNRFDELEVVKGAFLA